MPRFVKGGAARTPFGRNQWLASTRDVKTESRTFAASGFPAQTVDGNSEKILQPGTIIAKITSGADSGKVGVFDTGATDGRQTVGNIIGVNNTFLPYQLLDGDAEISVAYEAAAKAAWLISFVLGVPQAATSGAKGAFATNGIPITLR